MMLESGLLIEFVMSKVRIVGHTSVVMDVFTMRHELGVVINLLTVLMVLPVDAMVILVVQSGLLVEFVVARVCIVRD